LTSFQSFPSDLLQHTECVRPSLRGLPGKNEEKELYRLERKVSSRRTAVLRYRKAAAKRKAVFFSLCLAAEKKKAY